MVYTKTSNYMYLQCAGCILSIYRSYVLTARTDRRGGVPEGTSRDLRQGAGRSEKKKKKKKRKRAKQ